MKGKRVTCDVYRRICCSIRARLGWQGTSYGTATSSCAKASCLGFWLGRPALDGLAGFGSTWKEELAEVPVLKPLMRQPEPALYKRPIGSTLNQQREAVRRFSRCLFFLLGLIMGNSIYGFRQSFLVGEIYLFFLSLQDHVVVYLSHQALRSDVPRTPLSAGARVHDHDEAIITRIKLWPHGLKVS